MRRASIARLLVLAVAPAFGDEEKPQKPWDHDSARQYMEVRRKLDEMCKANPLGTEQVDEMKAMGEEYARLWREEHLELYGRTTLYLVQRLGSHDFHDKRVDAIRNDLTFRALERAELMPVDVHAGLAFVVQRPVDGAGNSLLGTAVWPKERRRMAEGWLRAWRRIGQAIDPNWNPEDRPSAKVSFPEVGHSGADPKSVKDPDLRRRYEAAIAANEMKKEAYSRQVRARQLEREFSWKFEMSLRFAYGEEPRDVDELTRLLEAYVADAAVRERVLRAAFEPDTKER